MDHPAAGSKPGSYVKYNMESNSIQAACRLGKREVSKLNEPFGWIKLHRAIKERAIWNSGTPEQLKILIFLLITVNFKANSWEWTGEKHNLNPGQTITSSSKIAKECGPGITRQKVRTALEKLEKHGILTKQSTSQGILITLLNWELYQGNNETLTNCLTSNQPAVNQQLTTIEERENVRREEVSNSNSINKLSFEDVKDQLQISNDDLDIVDYFIKKHKKITGSEHKTMTSKTWQDQILKMREVDLRDYQIGEYFDDLENEEIYQLIKAYFQVDYKECDYSIFFFNAKDVKASLYEELYNEDIREIV